MVGCEDSLLESGKWSDDDDADEEGAGDSTEMEEVVDAVDPLLTRVPFDIVCEWRLGDATFDRPTNFFAATTVSRRTSVLMWRREGGMIKDGRLATRFDGVKYR